jgi:hypothetical protein
MSICFSRLFLPAASYLGKMQTTAAKGNNLCSTCHGNSPGFAFTPPTILEAGDTPQKQEQEQLAASVDTGSSSWTSIQKRTFLQ